MTKLPLVTTHGVALRHKLDPLQLALHGGDDYELLFTVPSRKAKFLPKAFGGVSLTAVGRITRKKTLLVVDESGRAHRLLAGGWDPFRKKL